MRRLAQFLLVVCCITASLALISALVSAQRGGSSNIYGFSAPSAAAERSVERRFVAIPSPDSMRDAHQFLTAEPHVAGSPRDRVLAEWVRDRWREYGLEQIEIVQHDVLLPYANEVTVDMPSRGWRASLTEDAIDGDPFSAKDVGVAYHAYSASGEVTAPVVYANSGNPADYDWLAAHGIDIAGKVALVRYSMPYSYRGFKALTAEQRGAAGILIYSDPAEDGFRKGKTYPEGPWGPESHIQRGGIVYDFRVPGDPLTPGWASTPGARRIARADAISLPKIISAPLSWRDARAILEAMDGLEAPAAWQGGLPITYRAAGRSTRVHLRVRMDDKVRPIWTVTGRITGSTHPDQLVIVGNHRDAWVYGGVDPSSGTASLMELARSLGALAAQGLRPKRTIVFANWDAEEFTLTSSTEWGEQHARELGEHAVAYLNVDSAASGAEFKASAVPALNRVVSQSVRDVLDVRADDPQLVTNRLGSGSDYTVFLNFLGVPIADVSFTGPYGVYHSIYDNHLWVKKFGDPGFERHVRMTRIWGVMALRLANADVVPLDYRATAARIREFVDETTAAAPADDRQALAPLAAGADRFARAADETGQRIDALLAAGVPNRAAAMAFDRLLINAERAFLDPAGLPDRPWYRHLLYAPKATYAAEVLPGVTEALERNDRAQLEKQIAALAAALNRAAGVIAPR
ncbi:MAG TPA: M28 family metallopeptidase [Vicinamibacterales bacterium]|nr:M28 family metallopeptidase [Vicinamibacterales bacterium]